MPNTGNVLINPELSFSILETDINDIHSNPMRGADPDLHFFTPSDPSSISNYYHENSFNHSLDSCHSSNSISVLHHNIRGIPHNLSSLSLYLSSLHCTFDIIGITESWLDAQTIDSYRLNGYNQESLIRHDRMCGGVSIFVHENLRYDTRNDLNVLSETMEALIIEVTSLKRKVIFAVIYRPPGTDLSEFNAQLSELLEKVRCESKLCYVMGDFNIDLLKTSSHTLSSEFCHILYSHSFLPLITKPTRVTRDSATLIDNIFTNSHDSVCHRSGIFCTDVSDHYPVFTLSANLFKEHPSTVPPKFHRNFSPQNMTKFKNELISVNWGSLLRMNDAQESFSRFHKSLADLLERCFPKKITKMHYKTRIPWLTDGLNQSR